MTTRPLIGRPTAWAFPTATDRVLDNGLRVLAYNMPGQHVISVAVSLDVSLHDEPNAKEGLAALVQRTLDEGTATHPGASYGEALDDIGAVLDGHVSHSQSVLFLSVPSSRLEPALRLLSEALREPQFAVEDVERHKRLRLSELDQLAAQSSRRAEIAFRRQVLAAESRAARLAGGSAATVREIARLDVAEFHAAHYGPRISTIVLAGTFSSDPVALVNQTLGTWKGTASTSEHEDVQPGVGGSALIDRPGAVQADIRLGGFSIGRTDPRWAPLRVATYIVGGEFLSRLNRVLREERGYTYGVSMVQRPLRAGGYYAVRGSFRTEVTVAALVEAQQILQVTDFTSQEVDSAIDYFSGSTALRFSTAEGVADEVVAALGSGVSPEHIDETLRDIRQVTAETALAAYTDIVRPAKALTIVGEAEPLAGPLQAEGFDITRIAADEPLV